MKTLPELYGAADRPAGFRGVTQLSTVELLACFLEFDLPRCEAIHLAARILESGGGLRGLFTGAAGATGLETRWRLRIEMAGELAQRRMLESLTRGRALTGPADSIEYLQAALRDRGREVFTCLFLDTRHRVISVEELFKGSIDGACVYPRVVAERALRLGAAAVIVAHNHPSGVAEPSLADQAITRRLKDALALLEIRLLDHFVIGDDAPVSMAALGML